jgi:hypothetical protein
MRAESLIERAAGAPRFKDIADLLLWFVEQRQRNLAPGSIYTAIVGCLVERSPEDLPLDPKVTEDGVEQLLQYYLGKKAPPKGAELEELRRVRNCIRRRAKKRGLLIDRSGSGTR